MQPKNSSATHYRGRFAPSPTGDLHLGSLVAAVGGYLEAKTNHGEWLVRIDDLDLPRTISGAADSILKTLERHQLFWDQSVLFQSNRNDYYRAALENLRETGHLFYCQCSRNILRGEQIYPGHCRNRKLSPDGHAARITVGNESLSMGDLWQGDQSWHLQSEVGDFIVRRSDGLYAYQLAVVVDDFMQGITHIIRGSDLLQSTPKQLYLQSQLNYPTPRYGHLPIVLGRDGEKLSKQNLAQPLSPETPLSNIFMALEFLGQNPPPELLSDNLDNMWKWATKQWNTDLVPRQNRIQVKSTQ